jgi:hypothetical protein
VIAKQDDRQIKLHEEWKKKPETYAKPKREPDAPKKANLIYVPMCSNALGYIQFIDSKRTDIRNSAAIEFLRDDPEQLRKATLALKLKPGFHVYYKDGDYWYAVPKHFDSIGETMPYLQSGIRVLVEYKFTK